MKDKIFSGTIWNIDILGNTLYDYLLAIGIFVVFIVAFKWIQWAIIRSLENLTKRTKTEFDDAIITVIRTIKPPFYAFIAFYIALRYLNVEGISERVVYIILISWIVYQVIRTLQIFVDFFVEKRLSQVDKDDAAATHVIRSLANVVLWIVGVLFVLQNVGINVTSLIAGLGIGGIAVALAAQNILADLFSSLAIYFDKPFVPGDFIVVGDQKGTVQKIGIKTTRIKALDGEEIVVPNTELTNTLIKNIGRMQERRVAFNIGVIYETSTQKLKNIPDIIAQIINQQENTRFSRAHLHQCADSALQFEVVYFIINKDFDIYMDVHQQILLALKDAFDTEKIEFAYPTQTVYVNQ